MPSFFDTLLSGISVVLNPHLELAISLENAAIVFHVLLLLVVLLLVLAAIRARAPIRVIIISLVLVGPSTIAAIIFLNNLPESYYVYKGLDVYGAISIFIVGFSGYLVGVCIRSYRKYAIVFFVGLVIGIIIALTITQQWLLWGILIVLTIIDGVGVSMIFTNISYRNAPIESESIKPLVHLFYLFLFFMVFTSTLIPIEEISEGLLRTAGEIPPIIDAATGKELPPGPGYMEIISRVGADQWIFPICLIIGIALRFPNRWKNAY